MSYSFESSLSTKGDPIIIDKNGNEVVAVRIDDVWGPDNDVVTGLENAKFILSVLNDEDAVFPDGATPGPWRIEQDTCALEQGIGDSWFLIAGSPEGTEMLALFNTPMLEEMQWVVEDVLNFA